MQEKYWTRRKGEDFEVLEWGGGAHFKYVYIGCGPEVIRIKKFPPGNFYREFGHFVSKPWYAHEHTQKIPDSQCAEGCVFQPQ